MSRQEEEFKSRARHFVDKAARESGPYRDVLMGVAEAFEALATHQAVFDNWPRAFPGPPPKAPRDEVRQAPRPEPREPPHQESHKESRTESRQLPPQVPASTPLPVPRAAPVAGPKR